jgi:uncharacterized membrane protein YdbT with pleckstrin-like domain
MIDLNKDENVVEKIKRHWMYFFWPVLISFITYGVGIIWLIYRILRYHMDNIILTNQRFNMKVGVLSIENISTRLDKIQNIYYSQGILGRMLGYGTISIQSAATAGMVVYSYVPNPATVKQAIETCVEDYLNAKQKQQNEELAKQLHK